MCNVSVRVHGGQESVLDPPELKFLVVMNSQIQVIGTKLFGRQYVLLTTEQTL